MEYHYDLYEHYKLGNAYVFRATFKVTRTDSHYIASSHLHTEIVENTSRASVLYDLIRLIFDDWSMNKFRVYNGDRFKSYDITPERAYPWDDQRSEVAYHVTEKDGQNYRDDILAIQADRPERSLFRVCEWIA